VRFIWGAIVIEMTLEVADDGTLAIPVDLIRALRLSPRQTVTIEAQDDILVLEPSLRLGSVQARKERMDRIGHLLRTALAGVEWSEIEAGRRDRC
jgi:antitoxin component of MazEF toxin-antitoxin module